ncbi:universal stress protein [Actinomadura viridis]|uniref:Nucleotide-binding universal stress UspA family protein n=1 Tax=Actinomadura viridis TaxID=58110 RepID=A0A931DRC8_9ACTN|nr:universal stress protein [Actinomadura viridis]MBG6093358.1 nucleotide-binding universal stress UspA family protein [Actinomadura viridis]
MTILIAFDGSDDARAAIAYAGGHLKPEPAVVVTVWEPLLTELAWAPLGAAGAVPVQSEAEQWEEERQAERVAAAGAALAAEAGLPDSTPRAERGAGPIWGTIVDLATELDASLIVTGSRGLSAAKSVLLGSVSTQVLRHARRPTLIVPPPPSS